MNPHESLQLGPNQIETPAEIDGLLDDYFRDSNDLIMQPYDDLTGEMSSSQQSVSSNGRQRILYADPQEARQGIMGAINPAGSGSPSQRPNVPAGSDNLGSNAALAIQSQTSVQRMRSRFRENLQQSPIVAEESEHEANSNSAATATTTLEQTLRSLRLVDDEDNGPNTDSGTNLHIKCLYGRSHKTDRASRYRPRLITKERPLQPDDR